ncbi:DUF4937 domain-containing protein [Bacillus sp. NPDC077027]|uniref:DUF4937 domain-containing protein n=1 Tax=Bacillus sp. NPDC077027 TaxID=3390548 RepID=UPI003D03EDE3
MLIKMVRCEIEQACFYKAQMKWAPLKTVVGFSEQFGGFSTSTDGTEIAYIFAIWEGTSSYELFMKDVYDQIFEQTGQAGTFKAISIQFSQNIEDIWHMIDVNEVMLEDEWYISSATTSADGCHMLSYVLIHLQVFPRSASANLESVSAVMYR